MLCSEPSRTIKRAWPLGRDRPLIWRQPSTFLGLRVRQIILHWDPNFWSSKWDLVTLLKCTTNSTAPKSLPACPTPLASLQKISPMNPCATQKEILLLILTDLNTLQRNTISTFLLQAKSKHEKYRLYIPHTSCSWFSKLEPFMLAQQLCTIHSRSELTGEERPAFHVKLSH